MEPVRCTRLLGGVPLGFEHLKTPAFWRALQQTTKRLLQPRRDHGVGRLGILFRLPNAERTVLTTRLISDDEHVPEPLLGSIEGIELLHQTLDSRALF